MTVNEVLAETPPLFDARNGLPLFASRDVTDPIASELLSMIENILQPRALHRMKFDAIASILTDLHAQALERYKLEQSLIPALSEKMNTNSVKVICFVDFTCKQVCALLDWSDFEHLVTYVQQSGATGDCVCHFVVCC